MSEKVNCESIRNICKVINGTGKLFVHYSTDYVFDGCAHSPYTETDLANPINAYGKTKLNGENVLKSSDVKHFLFRTSWVYDNESDNFPNKIIRKLRDKEILRIIDDQIGVPNYANFISDISYTCIEKYFLHPDDLRDNLVGTYHMSSLGEVSWYEFAKYIVEEYCKKHGIKNTFKIIPIKSNDVITKAKRPKYSVLNTSKLSDTFGVKLSSWQDDVNKFINSKL